MESWTPKSSWWLNFPSLKGDLMVTILCEEYPLFTSTLMSPFQEGGD